MRILKNSGSDRVVDQLRPISTNGEGSLDLATPAFSLFAFDELREVLEALDEVRMILPPDGSDLRLHGDEADRPARNRLQTGWLARRCAEWLEGSVRLRRSSTLMPQAALVLRDGDRSATRGITGSFAFTSEGLGVAPGNAMSLIHAAESDAESQMVAEWFENQWSSQGEGETAAQEFVSMLRGLAADRPPALTYATILRAIFGDGEEELDEEKVVKSATGIRDTAVWNKLYKFQRDGVVGAIDKLNRFGGCIIADSVGLGKTFEALAVIKYHELRNDRVLVLCPKRLRENWTVYALNDRRNILAKDRFNYDVLNHTDLSRDFGTSGDIDLAHINWGNYDLVVIDESHNFRNKRTPKKGGETRYDRLMNRIIRQGVKTRVLMLSATPVNNRLADLRNQIAFATEGDDAALADEGIASIDATTRLAQKQFNRWLEMPDQDRTPGALVDMLGFGYFTLLDRLTIARSRRHIETYYGTEETGTFPERLPPQNIRPDVDSRGEFPSIRDINNEIRRLNLASYAPLRYVFEHKQRAYDEKYSTEIRGGEGFFRQVDREESLIHLLRVNLLKRMESSVTSFALTVQRQLADVERMLERIEAGVEDVEELDIEDVDLDDPTFESLLVGKKIKVLLTDVDLKRWKQDLIEDRNRLATLHSAAAAIDATRDAKLAALKEVIRGKCEEPLNSGNRKLVVFTAFVDTAEYLYNELAPWAKRAHGLEAALVTGSGRNRVTLAGLRTDMSSILSAFAPVAKERPEELAEEGEVELLIATDCISEGQNLQDCDWVVNFDIHWNPVRIIQRFGRIDRIASPNDRIQLVNFWPNLELEEYINLEQRVSGRMVLLDVSATGEENLIERQSGDLMNDLEYRRKQLLKLQEAVIDIEDLSSGVSITDLTLTDFRIDLAEFERSKPGLVSEEPLGTFAVVRSRDLAIPAGALFCLRAETEAAHRGLEADYPLTPHFLVHVGQDGTVALPYPQAKQLLDEVKRLCAGRDLPDAEASAGFRNRTRDGKDMEDVRKLLASAVRSVVGKREERAVESLFQPGGTHALKGEFVGMNDFEVVAFLVITDAAGGDA
ncbi:MAG: helicase-related protein [Gemmatimonadota bacterium]